MLQLEWESRERIWYSKQAERETSHRYPYIARLPFDVQKSKA